MPSQQQYDDALRKLKGKQAKRYEIEMLAAWAKQAGSYGNEVRQALRDALKVYGQYGELVKTEVQRLGLERYL